jgi:ligand-binding SRPBCC domain-containing protein
MPSLDAEMWLPLPQEGVFAFFSDIENLHRLTPPWVHFETLTPRPIVLRAGLVVEHRLRIKGIPIRWKSQITLWEPPTRFIDEQRRGPYNAWIHRHEFAAEDGGTWVRDHITYEPRGWLLAGLVNRWLVAPELRRIFAHRHARLRELLAPGSSPERDRIAFHEHNLSDQGHKPDAQTRIRH